MRFSSAIVLAVVAALASSISATPVADAGTETCATWCIHDRQCSTCPGRKCTFPWCDVSRVFSFTSVQYGSRHRRMNY
ncbi:hypothetical protein DFJ58DRAFT_69811 [Suillus subalutaceus]|uniref:uncharacterized protein n=1 Tax=Suillus subalutaceus TaxID=48586 RepID=UPI001B88266B|nr:uncharacterized protein DFJ58DRAFT_69811 [Suillus subalutaceus]KAG1841815.1 hypothetical protein DFJ58DRAFT_69811 [Suillus subalutaceus]